MTRVTRSPNTKEHRIDGFEPGPYTRFRAIDIAVVSAQRHGKPYVVSQEKGGGYAVLSFDFHHCHESEYGLTPIVTVFPGATPLPRQIID